MQRNGSEQKRPYQPEFEDEDSEVEAVPRSTNRTRARASAYQPPYGSSPRRPAAARDTSFNALLWLLEGATGVIEEIRHNDLGLTEDFWIHAYAARRESLLAMRAALEQFIESADSHLAEHDESEERRPRRGGINVDF